MPRVSIAVPVYGVEQYIERCARSLFEQTYPNIEYVFVNDYSHDNSLEILMQVADNYPERKKDVKIVHHEMNMGLASTRNDAIDNCTSVFITHVDSDDWIEPEMVSLMVKKQKETNADIVWGAAFRNGNEKEKRYLLPEIKEKEALLEYMLSHSFHHEIWAKLIRKSLYSNNNIKVEHGCNCCEDWQVLPRLLYFAKNIAFVDNLIYHYRYNPLSITKANGNDGKRKWEELLSLSVLYDFFKDKETNYKLAISHLYIDWIYHNMLVSVRSSNPDYFSKLNSLLDNCNYTDIRQNIGKCVFLKRNYYVQKILQSTNW